MNRSLIALSAVLMLTGTGLAQKPRNDHRGAPGPRYRAGCLFPGGFWFWSHPHRYAPAHRHHGDGRYQRDHDRGRRNRRHNERGPNHRGEHGREGRDRH